MSGWDKEMQKALETDGEKLRQMTGEDHGPHFIASPAKHIPGCGTDREAKMAVVVCDDHGNPTVFCDPCITEIVAALNAFGMTTVASCCGHGHRPGRVSLADGRELIIAKDADEAQRIETLFPVDINGDTA